MRGTRVKKLRAEFRQAHGRNPHLSEWGDLGRDRLAPARRSHSVISRFVGRIPFFRAIWSPAPKTETTRKTKLRWFGTKKTEATLAARSEWRHLKRVWMERKR